MLFHWTVACNNIVCDNLVWCSNMDWMKNLFFQRTREFYSSTIDLVMRIYFSLNSEFIEDFTIPVDHLPTEYMSILVSNLRQHLLIIIFFYSPCFYFTFYFSLPSFSFPIRIYKIFCYYCFPVFVCCSHIFTIIPPIIFICLLLHSFFSFFICGQSWTT